MVRERGINPSGRDHLRLIVGQDQTVCLWVMDHIQDILTLPGGYTALGVARGDKLVGGCVFTNYVKCPGGGDVQLWCAGEGLWISRRVIRTLLGYPFDQLGCHRVTAIIAKKNHKSRKLVTDLGFKLEGVVREGIRPGRDGCVYGLLKAENRWV